MMPYAGNGNGQGLCGGKKQQEPPESILSQVALQLKGVCTFDTPNEYMEASKASIGAQAQSGPGVLYTLFHKSY